jgi:hypothetical protein
MKTKDQQIKQIRELESKAKLLFWRLLAGAFLVFIFFLVFVSIPIEHRASFKEGVNSTQINISQAYYQGLLLWTQTGKLVYLEQGYNGSQMKEITISQVCSQLNSQVTK